MLRKDLGLKSEWKLSMPRQVATPIKLDIFWPKVPKTVQEEGEREEKEKKAGKLQMMIMDGGVDAADGDGRAGQGRAGTGRGECKVRLRLWVLLVVVLLGCLSGCWGWC